MIDFNDFNEDISDEMLAAYIDGNVTSIESALIESTPLYNDSLSEIIEITKDIDSYKAFSDNCMIQSYSHFDDEFISKVNWEETDNLSINNTPYGSFQGDDIDAAILSPTDDFPSIDNNDNSYDV